MRWEGGEGVIIHLPARARRLRWWAGFRQTRLVDLPLDAARLALVHRRRLRLSARGLLLLLLCHGQRGGTAGGGISGSGSGGEARRLTLLLLLQPRQLAALQPAACIAAARGRRAVRTTAARAGLRQLLRLTLLVRLPLACTDLYDLLLTATCC